VDRHKHTQRNAVIVVYQMHLIDYTSIIVFYRTRVYQMQPRNGQNWHSSVGKYVHHNREAAKIGIRTPLKLYVYFRLSHKQQASSRPHFRAERKVLLLVISQFRFL